MKEMLNGVIGNKAMRYRLGNDIADGKLPHALIIEGAYGSGKHTIAKMCAAALVCTEAKDTKKPLPCCQCLACRKVLENKSPDVILIGTQGKASIGVETVRFLKEDVSIVPNDSDFKVYIIENAEKMTVQAQNALLLTLEEPPKYVHFFLLCESTEPLLETIKSRAPTLRTEPVNREDIDNYLCSHDRRAAQMKLSDPIGYAELLTASGSGIGRALEYLEPKTFSPIRQTRALAEEFVTCAIKKRRPSDTLAVINKLSTKREPLIEQLSLVCDATRDLMLLKKSDIPSLLFFSDINKALELSDKAPLSFLYDLLTATQKARDELEKNANVRLCLMKMASTIGLL